MDPLSEFFGAVAQFSDIGATGLLVVVVVLILTGRLVPRSVSNDWRTAFLKSQEAHAVKDRIISDMAEAGIVSAKALDALPTPDGGESDAGIPGVRRRKG